MKLKPIHNFHIPVMGLSYTIDSPIKVAQYGISSVISIIDDEIIEKMSKKYSEVFNLSYEGISNKIEDYRAKRITHYLDMVDNIVSQKFQDFKNEISKNSQSLKDFIAMLPSASDFKDSLNHLLSKTDDFSEAVKQFIDEYFQPGEIDVNIMTKVDKTNYHKNEALPSIYNDAHSALRGFGNSKLSSSLILSAGMNPRLYSYLEEFEDFYPDAEGHLKKKVTLKVSDFRSAMIQGNFLAKKGIWVSEYRIESGLNCGGHAFATEGLLMGPILEEFKQKKEELQQSAHQLMVAALEQKGKPCPSQPMEIKITVQGGVGTAEEHQFLLNQYQVDSIGWGSPFLLVPEATTVDADTRALLAKSKEKDFYISNISPLGVPFNTVRGTTNEFIQKEKHDQGRHGSSCPIKLLALSTEYSPKGTCTASTKHQKIKFAELEAQRDQLDEATYEKRKAKITEKSCLCVGLANSAYLDHGIKIKGEKQGVVVCPGPNLAYFDKEVKLSEMVQHIYGNANVLPDQRRPNLFINELKLYVDYLEKEIDDFTDEITKSQVKKWNAFKDNLNKGIAYYQDLFAKTSYFKTISGKINQQLDEFQIKIAQIEIPKTN
ncbi:hypothetical protein [Elizabethkingia sp. JS20170427COW]|uniref:hypothetical protein n=1 Tax=Elizabethkingia sp. JS20170427COW TaxID=2583851 RepID=UPI00111013A0|nr:hypothetical protein [Elizabethkingia sp. JS20170427COW]QCX53915.1 hypothetical protein FGE20_09315 [Elizabethkingia sp. JS20170427COW]